MRERGNEQLTRLYTELYYVARDKALSTFKGDDLSYFIRTTD